MYGSTATLATSTFTSGVYPAKRASPEKSHLIPGGQIERPLSAGGAIPPHTGDTRNIDRIRSLVEYGLERSVAPPTHAFMVAPQVPLWAATTLYRDLMAMIRKQAELSGHSGEIKFVCLTSGRPERYVERAFDQVISAEAPVLAPALEVLLVPGVIAAAVVHSPLGAASGHPAPLGIGTFDNETVCRVQKVVRDALLRFNPSEETFESLARALSEPAAAET